MFFQYPNHNIYYSCGQSSFLSLTTHNNDVLQHYFVLGKAFGLSAREVLSSSAVISRDGGVYKELIGQYGSGYAHLSKRTVMTEMARSFWRYLTGYFTQTYLKHTDHDGKQEEVFNFFFTYSTKVSKDVLLLVIGGDLNTAVSDIQFYRKWQFILFLNMAVTQ